MARKTADTDVLELDETIETGEPEVMHIRLVDQRPSGFILDDGKRGTKEQTELTAPLMRFIPNFGYRRGVKFETDPRTGKKKETFYNEPIRYIKNQTEISVMIQDSLGIKPARASQEDKIMIRRGDFSVVNEGSFIGLFKFIKEAFYNVSNPNRSKAAKGIYEEVVIDKQEETINEYDAYLADAVNFVRKFYQRGPKGYIYNQEKINALADLFAIFAETPAGKITALNAIAKLDPKDFLERAEKYEQRNMTIIAHAISLGVLQIVDNVVSYASKEKVIMHLGSATMSKADQIAKIADLLETPDFTAAKEELLFEIELQKEKNLKN
jgi:hypothetical protein